MARRHFVAIYGAPATGKTSLCRYMEETLDFYYADVANAAARGGPMWKLASEQYTEHGNDRGLVTEGVLSKRDHRDRFCTNISRVQKDTLVAPVIFFLKDSVELLMERRSGWARRFGDLEHETGSEIFAHHVIDGEKYTSLEMRAQFIMDVLRGKGSDI